MKKSRSISPRPLSVHLQTRRKSPLPPSIRDDFYAYSSTPRFLSGFPPSSITPRKLIQPQAPATFSALFSRTSENGFLSPKNSENRGKSREASPPPQLGERKICTPKFKGKKKFDCGRESLGEILKGAAGKESPDNKNNTAFKVFGKKMARLDEEGKAKRGCKNFGYLMKLGDEGGRGGFVTEYGSKFMRPMTKDYFNDYSPFNC